MVILCSQEIYLKGKPLWLWSIFSYALHSIAPSEKWFCNIGYLDQQPKNICYEECLFMSNNQCLILKHCMDFADLKATNMEMTSNILLSKITHSFCIKLPLRAWASYQIGGSLKMKGNKPVWLCQILKILIKNKPLVNYGHWKGK